MGEKLSLVIVEEDRDRARLIVDGLSEAGDFELHVISQRSGLARRVTETKPDLVLIDVGSPSREVLDELTLASGPTDRPVAIFVDQSAPGLVQAAIEAGVSAYVVDGLRSERIGPVLETAIARFSMLQRMRSELEATRRALEDRKAIDRAKGLLMKARGIGEEEAYALLRKTAMRQGRKIADVAQALITAAGLLS